MISTDCNFFGISLDFDRVWVRELSGPLKNRHAVALELCANHVCLPRDDRIHAEGQIVNRNVIFPAITVAVERPYCVSSQLENSFANALAGDCAGVDTNAADHQRAVDDCDTLTHFRRTDGSFLSGWTAANHY